MLYAALCAQAQAISTGSLAAPMTQTEWRETLPERREMWLEMIGLSPMPERTPLHAEVTGTLDRGNYVVEKLHFQSLPGCYVAGNLYRPAKVNGPLPAVLYLCGHTKGKVNAPYQANPRWFGEHGYVALVLDPIQLGECQGYHHGTYRAGRWDWISRGYTPTGTEVWNAMRAIDYLVTRGDVDGDRIGVTGLSGGGVVSWFLGAADERVKCVVPVCQTGSVKQIVQDRATDGHCDCAFFINYQQWDTPDLGALIAPRPLLVAAGTEDTLWRPYAFRDVMLRIKHQYAALGVPGSVDLVEDVSPHGYTPRLRKAIFQWFNVHLKGDPAPVEDDVTDFVEPEENLLVFGGNLPTDDVMDRVEEQLISYADVRMPGSEVEWSEHRRAAIAKLRRTTFRQIPAECKPMLRDVRSDGGSGALAFGSCYFDTTDGVSLAARTARYNEWPDPQPLLACAMPEDAKTGYEGGASARPRVGEGIATMVVEVRNTGATSTGPGYIWTLRRAYPVCGYTLPERQVFDLLAGIALARERGSANRVAVYGEGRTAALAIYAALLDPNVGEVVLANPPETHTDSETPEFMGVLRTGDLPQNLALLYPRPITFIGDMPDAYSWTKSLYEKLGKGSLIRNVDSVGRWRPAE